MIEVDVTTEIWRTDDFTLVVMYPFLSVAYIKGLRGKYTRDLRKAMKLLLIEKGIKTVYYERRKKGKVNIHTLVVK